MIVNELPEQLSLFGKTSNHSFTPIIHLAAKRNPFLIIKLSRRMRRGWHVRWNKTNNQIVLTVPAAIDLAPDHIKHNLLEWTMLAAATKRKNREKTLKLRELQKSVEVFLENPLESSCIKSGELTFQDREIIKNVARQNSRRVKRLSSIGKYHDLESTLQEINRKYFSSKLDVKITWSSKIGGLSTHTIEYDTLGKKYDLISVSRAYDFSNVPLRALGGLIYHECLHVVVPPYIKNGRRVVHGSEFRKKEKEYQWYQDWVNWHRTKLRGNIRRLKIQRAMKRFKEKFTGKK